MPSSCGGDSTVSGTFVLGGLTSYELAISLRGWMLRLAFSGEVSLSYRLMICGGIGKEDGL